MYGGWVDCLCEFLFLLLEEALDLPQKDRLLSAPMEMKMTILGCAFCQSCCVSHPLVVCNLAHARHAMSEKDSWAVLCPQLRQVGPSSSGFYGTHGKWRAAFGVSLIASASSSVGMRSLVGLVLLIPGPLPSGLGLARAWP